MRLYPSAYLYYLSKLVRELKKVKQLITKISKRLIEVFLERGGDIPTRRTHDKIFNQNLVPQKQNSLISYNQQSASIFLLIVNLS